MWRFKFSAWAVVLLSLIHILSNGEFELGKSMRFLFTDKSVIIYNAIADEGLKFNRYDNELVIISYLLNLSRSSAIALYIITDLSDVYKRQVDIVGNSHRL